MGEAANDSPTPAEIARRRAWFNWYMAQLDRVPPGLPPRCPCCGYLTLNERCVWDICEVCYWEDDGQDDHNADMVLSGPNGGLSLTQARANYQRFGACEEAMLPNVRPPRPSELPERKPGDPG